MYNLQFCEVLLKFQQQKYQILLYCDALRADLLEFGYLQRFLNINIELDESLMEEGEQKALTSDQESKSPQKELRPRSNIVPGIFQEYKRPYIKVPPVSKDQLSRLVLKEGFKIKEAAKKLQIKYATAKTIIFHLREEKKQIIQVGSKMCSYTELQSGMISKLRIISTTSNDIISNADYHLVPLNTSQIH